MDILELDGYRSKMVIENFSDGDYKVKFYCNLNNELDDMVTYDFDTSAREEWVSEVFSNVRMLHITDRDQNIELEIGATNCDILQIYFQLFDYKAPESLVATPARYVLEVNTKQDIYKKFDLLVKKIKESLKRREVVAEYEHKSHSIKH